MSTKQFERRRIARRLLPLMLMPLAACGTTQSVVTPTPLQITFPQSVVDRCERLGAFEWDRYWSLDELERARYVATRDTAQEAGLSRCEGKKDDAVRIGADANRRLREAATP